MVKAALIFPGQGAQSVGMGKELADAFPEAREMFQAVDDALDFALSRLMWEGPEDELTRTHNAQPAILTHSLAVHAVAAGALAPVVGAGHSLGEYSAYAAAGTLSATQAARLVRTRGELMLAAGRERPGTMAAIVGLPTADVQRLCDDACTDGQVAVAANINTPEQTVISGDPGAVARAGDACRAAGAKRVRALNVSGAFHSPLMGPARGGLEDVLGDTALADPDFPVVANASAEVVTGASTARVLLGEQLTSPVRWVECMRTAAGLAGEDATFVEMGPGKVLAGLLKRIDRSIEVVSCEGPGQLDAFLGKHA